MQSLHEYIVKVEGLDATYQKSHDKYGFKNPAFTDIKTTNMVDTGIIVSDPMLYPDKGSIGKTMQFTYIEALSSKQNQTPQIEGHILISPEHVISIGGVMQGEFVSCKPIPLPKDGITPKNYKMETLDSLVAPELVKRGVHMSCGEVDIENQHFPVGTKVWWGKESYARLWWASGFLLRRPYILMWGDNVDKFILVK